MGNRLATAMAGAGLTMIVAGCGSPSAPPPAATTAPPAAAAAPAAAESGRVFFVRPKNGETIKTLSSVEFGSSGVTVAAVPPGEIAPAAVRPKTIHYHLGTDTDCLPAGTAIPKADPWIHFGDGKNVIEMSLAPGQHRIAVQAGDDRHVTIAGMCEVINVTVAP